MTTTTTTPVGLCRRNGILKHADADGDGRVNYRDLLIMAACYNKRNDQRGYDNRADYNEDCRIDYRDLLILAGEYNK